MTAALRLLTELVVFSAVIMPQSPAVMAQRTAARDPLAVARDEEVFEAALADSTVERRVTSWYHGFYLPNLPAGIRSRYTEDIWPREQRNHLDEAVRAGMDGPFTAWSMNALGAAMLDSLHAASGMDFPYFAHHSGLYRRAIDNGAVFADPSGQVACWDDRYSVVACSSIRAWLKQYGGASWLDVVRGKDEPLNYAYTIRYPAAADSLSSLLREEYGLPFDIPHGDPDTAWADWPTPPVFHLADRHDIALFRIAVNRWLNGRLAESARREHAVVRNHAPGAAHHAYNRNAINIRDAFEKPVRHSIDFLDQSAVYDFTDGFSADPYPTLNLQRDGRARALYHVGFTSKLVTDLACGKPVTMILQAFEFAGRLPTNENLREWTSQAAKTGARDIEWFTAGAPRYSWPELYAETLRLTRLWKDLPVPAIPDCARIAVIFSDDSRSAVNDASLNAHYCLHAILGEQLGAWFTFVGENHVRKGLQSLEGFDIIVAPRISYVSRGFAETLEVAVRSGATLVVMDPDALSFDFESGPLDAERSRLLGHENGSAVRKDTIGAAPEAERRFPGMESLPVFHAGTGAAAYRIAPPGDAEVLFRWEDGSPAAYNRRLGDGEVIVFGMDPFGTAAAAVLDSGWRDFFAYLCGERGITVGEPLWNFMFPETGGEVRRHELLMDH